MSNNAYSEVVQNNSLSEGIEFSIHVHRAMDMLQGKRTINAHSEVVKNNLQTDGAKFSIHEHCIGHITG